MRMKLSELEFIRLLPQFMREDAAVKGLASGLDIIIPQLSESIKFLTTWDQIDNLSEAELDELAWELNILWYELDADISIKREVIKNSDKVFKHLGTKWAVENVIESYFGNGYIKEWFEYDGQPGRFRVHTTNPTVTGVKLSSFLNLLYKVKRASAKLEAVYIDLDSSGRLSYCASSELAGKMDVWPMVAREINTTGGISYGAVTEMGGTEKVWPLVIREIDTTGQAGRGGFLTYHSTLEIYPQEFFPNGGLTNG